MNYSFYDFGTKVLFVCPECGHSCSKDALDGLFGRGVDLDLSKVSENGIVVGSGIRIRKE